MAHWTSSCNVIALDSDRRKINENLDSHRWFGMQQFLPISSTVVVDSPKDAIVEEAERWGADLIVVGSHGYRGPERALLGSVSQSVATQARCSVEIARRRQVDDDQE